jgi:PAS domain S-box-containing protein
MENNTEEFVTNKQDRYEKLFSMLIEAIPSSVLLIDRNLQVIIVNRNFLIKSRRSLSTTIYRSLDEIFPPILLEHMDIKSRIRQVFESNQPTEGERMEYRAPGLPIRIYWYRIFPFSWKGSVEYGMLLMDDVTEQVRLSEEVRRIEHHLASIVESASDIVLSTDTEGKILTWNTAAEKLTNYPSSILKGKPIFQYFDKEEVKEREEVKEAFSTLKKGYGSYKCECSLVTTEGGKILVSWTFSPMTDVSGKTVGIVAVGRDLTEQRKMETQILQSQKLASLGVMAGGIAHEIRNPLAVCNSAAQFLMEDDLEPEFQKECAAKIRAGIQRASIIIENLLRFARPSAADINMTQVNIISLLEDTLTLIANQARIHKVVVQTNFPEQPVYVNGIASLMQQMFMNLFLNATNAMPDGGTLNIDVAIMNGKVEIGVGDTGRGISKADVNNIFDPFFTKSPVGTGTGLGLSICYSIAKQHFGTIDVDSVEGKGSIFTVKLRLLG